MLLPSKSWKIASTFILMRSTLIPLFSIGLISWTSCPPLLGDKFFWLFTFYLLYKEGDTVVGKRNGKETVILTLLEKKTQHYLAIRIPGKTSEAINATMRKLREAFGESFFSQIFKTVTMDNGPEFADFAQTEQFGTKVYFGHPYTSWERAQNERENGMLRRYIPKGGSIENFSDEEILWAADALNSLPNCFYDHHFLAKQILQHKFN